MKSNPLLGLGISLGGGALGSLFDMLRAKKEEEQAAAQQYAQQYAQMQGTGAAL